MNSQFKPNNVFAILIAVALMAAGFILSFINKQMDSEHELTTTEEAKTVALPDQAVPADAETEVVKPREDNGDR
ncbi:MAG: hypothetical protein OQJ84_02835 [Xanthomonadales bacterium]|nr:hypothetical protein [Xanthomonadales bacterium]